jgi:predicted component of type VI protein secretion system
MTELVSLQKCLESVLDRAQAKRYLKNTGSSVMSGRFYYNNALRDLNAKNSESAIHNLILALDIERNNEPALHLVKTMLFGLSKKFNESGGEHYKIKYANMGNWINSIEKKIQEIDKKLVSVQNEKKKDLDKKKGLWIFFQKMFSKNKVSSYDIMISQLQKQKEELKRELSFAAKLSQIGEYAKVLSLVLEICLYPARYAWVIA